MMMVLLIFELRLFSVIDGSSLSGAPFVWRSSSRLKCRFISVSRNSNLCYNKQAENHAATDPL
jgi:hypothetical protein